MTGTFYKKIRARYLRSDGTFLYMEPVQASAGEVLKVRCDEAGRAGCSHDALQQWWKGAPVNLLDAAVDAEGVCMPSFMVLEPDYLMDISSLAECFKPYGHHPANYFLSRLQPSATTGALLLGNIANLFLDEWIHAQEEVDYAACMKKAFRRYAVELTACDELKDKRQEKGFFDGCRLHFRHIGQVVAQWFGMEEYGLDKTDAVLEPSYVCEALGIQGRLDYMQRDMRSFIEMKSGKAEEYPKGTVRPRENNLVQMLLYMAVLEYDMGQAHERQRPYLLYTRYPLLYPSHGQWDMVREAICLRNRIVACEYQVQAHNDPAYTARMLDAIVPETLNTRRLGNRFWNSYLRPSISHAMEGYHALSPLERSYYLSAYNFITKELYLSKTGNVPYDERKSGSACWLLPLKQKLEAGEILLDLRISGNHATEEHKPYVVLDVPPCADGYLPNFRAGDIVVLYERNTPDDNVTNRLVFKGNIESITPQQVKVRLRAAQRNEAVLPPDSRYALEHDSMDVAFRIMYQGLHHFSTAVADRRSLLLSQRLPRFDDSFEEAICHASDDFERVALKALAAQDYFLLVGPPGTGKTSRALRRMVEKFHAVPGMQILLLAYTNRAVDEICKSLCAIRPEVHFMRIGNELSCEESYQRFLMENVLASCRQRSDIEQELASCRIMVGTTTAVANKPDLFRLKSFHVAIIDEATQILEPQLLGLLTMRDAQGHNAIGKFILIGDHKQLPAIALQGREDSRVADPALNAAGLYNWQDSLFERLYRRHQEDGSRATDFLNRQGRMHPEVASYANLSFYGGKLTDAGLPHQSGRLVLPEDCRSPWKDLLGHRVAFIPSEPQTTASFGKSNQQEARIAARLAAEVFRCRQQSFDAMHTLGIITPYRSQIALIRKELSQSGIPELGDVLVDTVERYQGSERAVIIYSVCANYAWQLPLLSNLTEEDGHVIDRKLNVALTRAREQFFLIGAPSVLREAPLYKALMEAAYMADVFHVGWP